MFLMQRTTQWVWQFFWLQSMVLCGYVACFLGSVYALSAVMGGFSYLVIQLCFIRLVFSKSGAHNRQDIVRLFFRAETFKLLAFAFSCYLSLQCLAITPMIFLGATVVAQSVYFWGPRCLHPRGDF